MQTARRPSVVKRALKVGLIVGTVLTLINQSEALLSGQLTGLVFLKIALTYCVPYSVSTYAAVGAIREQDLFPK